MDMGTTNVDRKVVATAIRHVLESTNGIDSCTVDMATPTRALIDLRIGPGAVEASVSEAVEQKLGMPFWIDLGMADASYSIRSITRSS